MGYKSVTSGISVSVKPKFERIAFVESSMQYVYSYFVTIENQSAVTVQLLRRRWEIINGYGVQKVVEGDGVIGKQPTLKPGESHSYNSWCPLPTTTGKMRGNYTMQIVDSQETLVVEVPEFLFHAGFVLN